MNSITKIRTLMDYLGLNQQKTAETVKQLNKLLSNYHLYYQNLRNFHWNVQGENFFKLHEKFEELYDSAKLKIDEIAERILTLRNRPVSRMSEYLDISEVKEAPMGLDDRQMVEHILQDHKIMIKNMREVLKLAESAEDEGTIDMISGFIEEMEKTSWMLDAWRARVHEKAAVQ